MSELKELYQQVILDHSKRPRNFHEMDAPDHTAEGHNPLCGDRITVFFRLDGDMIREVSFTGSGCAICTSSSSMMTEFLVGKTVAEALAVFEKFRDVVMGKIEVFDVLDDLDKLAVFSGVREFPIRVKCATLPWHTVHAALTEGQDVVSTE
ncbi:MAG: SUF system NifU family Fe-S cluster assembly protein [Phycisphaeraceae bacterium]|nr:SUF system NifU family Fe-S cluster assembly protein [Phycisphaeraceae bacterium]